MARYFCDYSVGTSIVQDQDGAVCNDDNAAIRHAQVGLSKLLTEHKEVLPWQHFEVIVRREDGANIGRLGMTLLVETINPATAAALASSVTNGKGHNARGNRP